MVARRRSERRDNVFMARPPTKGGRHTLPFPAFPRSNLSMFRFPAMDITCLEMVVIWPRRFGAATGGAGTVTTIRVDV